MYTGQRLLVVIVSGFAQILQRKYYVTSSHGALGVSTNDPEVLATIMEEDTSLCFLELSEDKLATERALSVTWDAQEDTVRFSALKQDPATTK